MNDWTDESWIGDLDTDDEAAGRERVLLVAKSEQRLDKYLANRLGVSRTVIQQLVDDGRARVDGRVAKASKAVQAGQQVQIDWPPPVQMLAVPEDIPLDIVYEDDDLLVVNKPRGMVVHPAPGHSSGTLVNALLGRFAKLPTDLGTLRPGIVHRIDKDTSGLLVVAKSDLAERGLAEQLKAHTMTRVYHALVHGTFGHERGRVDAPVGRHPHKRQQMAVREDGGGRQAVTHFRVLETFTDYSHLELRLETGRTHQIRVHMAYIGHPVAGDPVYATQDPLRLAGQALHAGALGFVHPRTGNALLFHAPFPAVLESVLQTLRLS